MLFLQALIALSLGVLVRGEARIEERTTAAYNEYPYVVSVQYFGEHVCGGSIISKYWILTAAHCLVDRNIDLFKVVASSRRFSDKLLTYSVDRIVTHVNYTEFVVNYPDNNIGMLRVDREIVISDHTSSIALPYMDFTNYELSGNFVSWGIDGPADDFPVDDLRSIKMGFASTDSTTCRYAKPELHICATNKRSFYICPKDDGGPLEVNGVLVGIASKFVRCERYSFTFTKVWHYIDWIQNVIRFGTQIMTTPTTSIAPTTTTPWVTTPSPTTPWPTTPSPTTPWPTTPSPTTPSPSTPSPSTPSPSTTSPSTPWLTTPTPTTPWLTATPAWPKASTTATQTTTTPRTTTATYPETTITTPTTYPPISTNPPTTYPPTTTTNEPHKPNHPEVKFNIFFSMFANGTISKQ